MEKFSARQKEIIDESIKLIAEKGIQELTIKNISKRIGVSEPAIYRHFESKMDILLAVLECFCSQARQLVELIDESEPPIDKIKTLFLSRCNAFSGKPYMASVIFSEDSFRSDLKLSDKIFSIMKFHAQTLGGLIKQGQDNGSIRDDINADQLSMVIMGILRLTVTRWRYSEYRFDLNEQAQQNWKTIETLIAKR